MWKKPELNTKRQVDINVAMNAVLEVAEKLKVAKPEIPLLVQSFALQDISMHLGWYVDEIITYAQTVAAAAPPRATEKSPVKSF